MIQHDYELRPIPDNLYALVPPAQRERIQQLLAENFGTSYKRCWVCGAIEELDTIDCPGIHAADTMPDHVEARLKEHRRQAAALRTADRISKRSHRQRVIDAIQDFHRNNGNPAR